ncbi:MAG TPA: F0F1 ATP synthase subunit B [Acidimicrobiales bacterium]
MALPPAILGAVQLLAAETEEKTVNNPILPTGNEFFWAAVTFVVLWILMKFVLLPPILKIMAERSQKQADDLRAAEEASVQMSDAEQRYEASLAGAKSEAVAKIEAARAEAEEYRKGKLAEAEADAAATRAASAAAVADARATALADLQGSLADIAVGAAEAVVQRPIDRDAQVQVIEDYVNRAEQEN